MKMDCNVIKDLMVLYDVGNCSEESEALIRGHIETCESCKKIWDEMVAQSNEVEKQCIEAVIKEQSAAEFQHLQGKVKRNNRKQAILLSCLLLVGLWVIWSVVDWIRLPYDLSADEIQISNVYENGETFGFKVTLVDGKAFVGNTYYSAGSFQGKGCFEINMGRDRFAKAAESEELSSMYIDFHWDVEKLYFKNSNDTYTLLWEREDGVSPLTEEIQEDMERVEQAREEWKQNAEKR